MIGSIIGAGTTLLMASASFTSASKAADAGQLGRFLLDLVEHGQFQRFEGLDFDSVFVDLYEATDMCHQMRASGWGDEELRREIIRLSHKRSLQTDPVLLHGQARHLTK